MDDCSVNFDCAPAASLVIVLLVTSACTPPDQDPRSLVGKGSYPPDVVVTRADIRSVVSLDASVVNSAPATLTTRSSGGLFRAEVDRGTLVEAGQRLATVRGVNGGTEVVKAPVQAAIRRVLAADGAQVQKNQPLFAVNVSGFSIVATAAPELLYRLQSYTGRARSQVINGVGPFDCPLVGQPFRDAGDVRIVCRPDRKADLYPGTAAIMAVEVGEHRNVLTLPLSAVAGRADRGVVQVREGGGYRDREVGLGLSDGSRIEITSGLAENDAVRAVAPDLVLPDRPR